MFDKLMGKKKKEIDFFRVPEKRYTTETRIIAKMSPKALQELVADMEKYISVLIDKLEHGKSEYEKATEKNEELQEKNEVVNAQVSRMNNEHEELTIKFDNLQVSLQMLSTESDQFYRKEIQYLTENEVACEKARSLGAVINIYREKMQLCKKIQMQNRNLKTKYTELQESFQEMKGELEKEKGYGERVPLLTQEVAQLREKVAQLQLKEEVTREGTVKFEQGLGQRIKNELETVSTLRSDEEDHDERNKMLQLQLERVSQELVLVKEQLRQSLQKQQQSLLLLNKNTESLLQTERLLSQAKDTIRNSQHSRKTTEAQLEELQKKTGDRIDELQGSLESAALQLVSYKQEASNKITNLQNCLGQSSTQLQNLQRETSTKIANLESNLQSISAQLKGVQEEASNKIGNLEGSVERYSVQAQSLKQELSEYEIRCKQLSNIAAQVDSLRSQNTNLIAQCDMLDKGLASSQEENNKYQAQLELLRQTLTEKQEEVSRERQNKAALQNIMADKSNSEVDHLMKIKVRLEEDLQEMKKVLDSNKRTVNEHLSKISQLTNEVNDCQSKTKQLGDQKDQLIKSRAKAEEDLQEVNKGWDSTKKTVNEQLARINQLGDELTERQLKIKQLTDEKDLLVKGKAKMEQDCQEVKKGWDGSKKTIGEQQLKIKQLSEEAEQLMKAKAKLEQDLQEIKRLLESSKKTTSEQQSKIKHLSDEVQSFKTANKNLLQQKMFIQENSSNCLKISQQQSQRYRNQAQDHKKQGEDIKRQMEAVLNRLKTAEDQIRNYGKQTELLNRIIQTKEGELKKSYTSVHESDKQKAAMEARLGEMQQDNKIRMRKYESELNQQRIKMQSLNRKLTTLQTKAEQNKMSMDNMYEQLLAKEKKNTHMETKLKEYKYMIQLLKKEKHDLEKTYENKINDMRFVDLSIEDVKKVSSLPVVVEEEDNGEKDKLTNQLFSTKEQNLVILAQNKELRATIDELRDIINEKERSVKLLQEKRDQMMKEIQKIGRKNGTAPDLAGFLSPSSQIRIEQSGTRQNREKKIATKAHKGFQILIKLQHQLYKAFVGVFTKQLQREDVKRIQCDINTLIKKSSDMCDIFEDYL